jgi:hypothetical protein
MWHCSTVGYCCTARLKASSAPGVDIALLRQLMKEASPAIIPLIIDAGGNVWLRRERHLCLDLTASGGNLALLSR